jgi:hypothetical protein
VLNRAEKDNPKLTKGEGNKMYTYSYQKIPEKLGN